MSVELRAAMQLRLEDLLSEPLAKIQALMARIGELGKTMSFDTLTDSLDSLNAGADAAQRVVDGFEQLGDQASAAGGEASRALALIETSAGRSADTVDRMAAAMERAATAAAGLHGTGVLYDDGTGAGNTYGAPGENSRFAEARRRADRAARGTFGGDTIFMGPPGGGADAPFEEPEGMPELRPGGRKAAAGSHGTMDGIFDALALYEPVKAYAEYEQLLRQIAITEGLSGKAVAPEEARLAKLFNADALKTGQSSESIGEAYYDLLGQGIARALLDKTIGIHSEAATAYGVTAETLGKPVGALLGTLGIDETTLAGTLSALAVAAKSGRFKVRDFSDELPNISGQAGLIGLTGRRGVDEIFAVMETVMKNTGLPSSAATNLVDLITQMFTAREDKRADKLLGVNLPDYLKEKKGEGVNALDAFMGLLRDRTQGMDGQQIMAFLTPLIMNQQARAAAIALLQHGDYETKLQARLDHVGSDTLTRDFTTASGGAQTGLNRMRENAEQGERGLGQGFAPTLELVNFGLGKLNSLLQWSEEHWPTGTNLMLGFAAGMLALVVGLAAFSFIAGAVGTAIGLLGGAFTALSGSFVGTALVAVFSGVGTAIGLLLSPIGLVVLGVGALATAGYELYKHWKQVEDLFERMTSHGRTGPAPAGRGSVHAPEPTSTLSSVTAGGRGSVHQVKVDVHVTTDQPGTKAAVTSTTVTTAPNRGPTLGRP